jgi:hypothetical protein
MTKQMRPGEMGAELAGEDRTPPIEWSQIRQVSSRQDSVSQTEAWAGWRVGLIPFYSLNSCCFRVTHSRGRKNNLQHTSRAARSWVLYPKSSLDLLDSPNHLAAYREKGSYPNRQASYPGACFLQSIPRGRGLRPWAGARIEKDAQIRVGRVRLPSACSAGDGGHDMEL